MVLYSLGTNLVTQCQTRSIARREKSFVVKIPSLQKKKAISPTFTIEQKLLCLTQSFFSFFLWNVFFETAHRLLSLHVRRFAILNWLVVEVLYFLFKNNKNIFSKLGPSHSKKKKNFKENSVSTFNSQFFETQQSKLSRLPFLSKPVRSIFQRLNL